MSPVENREWPLIGMTLQEAADALRINRRTLMALIRDKEFPARKVGGKAWRILPSAVEQWLSQRDPADLKTAIIDDGDDDAE